MKSPDQPGGDRGPGEKAARGDHKQPTGILPHLSWPHIVKNIVIIPFVLAVFSTN